MEDELSRPRKDGVDYFPHFVNWGKTIPILESRFGNDGYAFWFKLLESLGKSKTHSVDCTDPMEWEYLVSRARVDAERAESILALLVTLGAIDRELWESKRTIYAANLVENIAGVYDKRGVSVPEKPDSAGFCDGNNGVAGVPVPEKPHSIGKERKADKSKEESATPPAPPIPKWNQTDFENAASLKAAIIASDPDYAARSGFNLEKWADEFRLIREQDKRAQSDIETILSRLPQSEFWAANIRSPKALRGETKKGADKFAQVLSDLTRAKPQGKQPERGAGEMKRMG